MASKIYENVDLGRPSFNVERRYFSDQFKKIIKRYKIYIT